MVNRNNIVILHLIQIQKRLFLIGFTINIIQLEMIKETIVKPYRFTQGFYPSVSLFLYLNREANQNNHVSFLLHIYLHFCSKKAAEQHFPWRHLPHSNTPAYSLPDLVTASLPDLATSQFFQTPLYQNSGGEAGDAPSSWLPTVRLCEPEQVLLRDSFLACIG